MIKLSNSSRKVRKRSLSEVKRDKLSHRERNRIYVALTPILYEIVEEWANSTPHTSRSTLVRKEILAGLSSIGLVFLPTSKLYALLDRCAEVRDMECFYLIKGVIESRSGGKLDPLAPSSLDPPSTLEKEIMSRAFQPNPQKEKPK